MAKLTDEEREILISALTENGAIEEDDVESVSSLTDNALVAFTQNVLVDDEELEEEEETVENMGKGHGKKGKIPPQFKKKMKGKAVEEEEEDMEDEAPTKNTGKQGCTCGATHNMEDEEEIVENEEPMTDQEWLDSAPEGIRSVVMNALKHEQAEKTKLIEKLTANVEGIEKKRMAARLGASSLEDLQDLEKLIPAKPEPTANARRFNYAGAGTTTQNAAGEKKKESAPLLVPTINYAEISAFKPSEN